MKATARAHPVQGLITHTVIERLPLPFYDFISVCTAPLQTVTSVTFQEEKEIIINGVTPDYSTCSTIDVVMSTITKAAGIDEHYKIVSQSTVPGTGVDASGVAALTVAASTAAGLNFSLKELSKIAAKGKKAASRAVTGWFSRWKAAIQEEFCYSYVIDDTLEMGILAVLTTLFDIPVHTILTSQFLELQLKSVHTRLYEMEKAIKDHDIPTIGRLAEEDSAQYASLVGGALVWQPDIVQVVAEVKALRKEGVTAYYSVDAGAVYINTYPEDVTMIQERLKERGIEPVALSVGGKAAVLNTHLF
jgi:phosphomevalonate decarboxylase